MTISQCGALYQGSTADVTRMESHWSIIGLNKISNFFFFVSDLSTFWLKPKCTVIWSEKCPVFVPLGPICPTLCPSLWVKNNSPSVISVWPWTAYIAGSLSIWPWTADIAGSLSVRLRRVGLSPAGRFPVGVDNSGWRLCAVEHGLPLLCAESPDASFCGVNLHHILLPLVIGLVVCLQKQECQIWPLIGLDWYQLGKIWDFLRSVFCSFWLTKPKWTENWS